MGRHRKAIRTIPAALVVCAIAMAVGCVKGPTTIHGTAYVNGQPAPGAGIKLEGDTLKLETTADEKGLYSFANVPPGKYDIQIYWVNGGFAVGEATHITVRGGKRKVDLRE